MCIQWFGIKMEGSLLHFPYHVAVTAYSKGFSHKFLTGDTDRIVEGFSGNLLATW